MDDLIRRESIFWKQLPGYEIVDIIHPGTVVYVFQARQLSLVHRRVMIQTLSPTCRLEPCLSQYGKVFQHAATIMSQLEHPNIASIIDFGYYNSIPYIVMQGMSNGTLRHYMERKKGEQQQGMQQAEADDPFVLHVHDTVRIVEQVGTALEYLHSKGQYQGDPCLTNNVVDCNGNAYISGFIKRAFDEVLPSAGFLGMPAYCAPERWIATFGPSAAATANTTTTTTMTRSGDGSLGNASTDQYALACIAFELLTGQMPYIKPSMSTSQMRDCHMLEPVPVAHTIRTNISPNVSKVLSKAMSKHPSDRYATVGTFVREFVNSLKDRSTQVFLSYSRSDINYVNHLKDELIANGFQVWFDQMNIEQGHQWWQEIVHGIQDCAAVIVIMTPTSEQSEWVAKELLLAKKYQKPIFPILLSGTEFDILIDTQYEDVRLKTATATTTTSTTSGSVNGNNLDTNHNKHQSLPGSDFYRRLSKTIYGE